MRCITFLVVGLLAILSSSVSLVASLPSSTGNRVLVVLEESNDSPYSTFFSDLTSRGYTLSFKSPRSAKPELITHDVLNHDHLVLLTPNSKSLSQDLTPKQLVEFMKQGGNIVFGFDSSLSELWRDLAREFSLEFEEKGSALVDHFHFDETLDAGNHTTVLVGGKATDSALPSGGLVNNPYVFSPETLEEARSKPLLYRGVVHRVGSNPLAFPLILPPSTSYSSEATLPIPEKENIVESTSYSTPAPVTITTTKVVDGETISSETLSTPRPVPTVVKTKSASKLGKNGWVAKKHGSLEPLESKSELVAGIPTKDIVASGGVDSNMVSLVSAFQLASNSARAVFLGSVDMLSNQFMEAKTSSVGSTVNRKVARDLTQWTFQEKSVLKLVATNHHRVKSNDQDIREDYEETEAGSKMYRIKDHVYFAADVMSHDPIVGWKPAPKTLPLQVAFNMLDPYITAHLSAQDDAESITNSSTISPPASSSSGEEESKAFTRYQTTFQVPDRHGVFTFHLNFKRQGLTFLESKDTAPVRPFNHDEYPRFLSSSWPYITGAFSTVLGFIAFCALWMLSANDAAAQEKKTK